MNNDWINDYLMHHGIRGQKWGIRRFQNPDGSLTPRGKKRYLDKDGWMTKDGMELSRQAYRDQARAFGTHDSEALAKAYRTSADLSGTTAREFTYANEAKIKMSRDEYVTDAKERVINTWNNPNKEHDTLLQYFDGTLSEIQRNDSDSLDKHFDLIKDARNKVDDGSPLTDNERAVIAVIDYLDERKADIDVRFESVRKEIESVKERQIKDIQTKASSKIEETAKKYAKANKDKETGDLVRMDLKERVSQIPNKMNEARREQKFEQAFIDRFKNESWYKDPYIRVTKYGEYLQDFDDYLSRGEDELRIKKG